MKYQRPSLRTVQTVLPCAFSQYVDFSSGTGSTEVPTSASCSVEDEGGGIAACVSGTPTLTNYRVIVTKNGSTLNTFVVDGSTCTASTGSSTCSSGSTLIFCETSLTFDTTNTYALKLQRPSPDDTIAGTTGTCPATST
ncbi:MAG: hypothetical protein HYS08_01400 [Chlamydiae bacterium]|nr:hypothetical protein [Chlamydiota bacterium]MBI3265637.1 hypothetical protein [Chlamydiota bacterium]